MCEFPGRRVLEAALILPLAAPAYVLAYAYAGFLSAYGPVQEMLRAVTGFETGDYWFPDIRSLPGAALMLVLVLYPYVYLLVRARFVNESASARDAARLLGRGAWSSFFAVSLPLARPALVAGAALAAMNAFADYGTVSYFGVPVFTTGIYSAWFSFSDPVAARELAAVLIGFVALALLAERFLRGKARFHETGRRDRRPSRYVLSGAKSAGVIIACVLPPLLGFVVPALVLGALLIELGRTSARFLQAGAEHADAGGERGGNRHAGRAGAGVCAQRTSRRHRRTRGLLRRFGLRGARLGDRGRRAGARRRLRQHACGFPAERVRHLLRPAPDRRHGRAVLCLYGALPGRGAAKRRRRAGARDAFHRRRRAAARARTVDVLRRVHLPLIAPSVLTAALLVFVDVMKELPATLVLRPFNFDTLAIKASNYASDERLSWAAAPSLAIVAAGIIPCILLIRSIAASAQGRNEPLPLP